MFRPILIAASVAILSLSGVAAAETNPRQHVETVSVDLDGFNLNSQRGARGAYFRLKSAARDVCNYDTLRGHTRGQRACAFQTLASAVERVDAPLVTAAYMKDMCFSGRVELADRGGALRR
jgi:UrcA family protein